MFLINDIFGLKEQLIIFMREWLTCTCSGCIHDWLSNQMLHCPLIDQENWLVRKGCFVTKTDDRLLVKRLITPIDWMTHYWLQNCLSDDKLFVCDFGRLHVCAILSLLLRNCWVHFKSLLLFHSSSEKKGAQWKDTREMA